MLLSEAVLSKRTLLGAYIYQGETYGPGEAELPDNERLATVVEAGEIKETQRLAERMASAGIDPVTMGLPETQSITMDAPEPVSTGDMVLRTAGNRGAQQAAAPAASDK
jgi:hypothetical protein